MEKNLLSIEVIHDRCSDVQMEFVIPNVDERDSDNIYEENEIVFFPDCDGSGIDTVANKKGAQ